METAAIPKRIRRKFVDEILNMYASGEISAGKASEMLGIPRAAFYTFPRATLWKALDTLCRQKMLTRPERNSYVQRMPPKEYFSKELFE